MYWIIKVMDNKVNILSKHFGEWGMSELENKDDSIPLVRPIQQVNITYPKGFADTCNHGVLLANSCEKCCRDMSIEVVEKYIPKKVHIKFLSDKSYIRLEIRNGEVIVVDAYYIWCKEIE